MELQTALLTRRSVRAFTDKAVPEALLRQLVELANWAPSAGNLQARDFIVVRDAATRSALARAADTVGLAQAAAGLEVCFANPGTTEMPLVAALDSVQGMRAARLVVDTGIHSEGWTRAQAVRYFENNTALSTQNINTEVDRYIAWPGQALSYMIGEIEIKNLRTQAEKELGSKFDIKAFHAAVLEHGALPLTILRQVVDKWIQDSLAGKSESAHSS